MASLLLPQTFPAWMRTMERRMSVQERRGQWNDEDIGAGGGAGGGRGITSAVVNASGDLIITYTDGSTSNAGHVVGTPGAPGTPGRDGRGITSAIVDATGSLLINYTDGTQANVGHVVGAKGDKGDPGPPGPAPVAPFCTADPEAAGSVCVGYLDNWWSGEGASQKQGRTAPQMIHYTDAGNPNIFVQEGFNGGGQFERGFYDPNYTGPGAKYRLIDTVTVDKALWWMPVGMGYGLEFTDGIFGDKSKSGLVLRDVEIEQGPSGTPQHHISYLVGSQINWPTNVGDAVYLGAWSGTWNIAQVIEVDVVDSGLSTNALRFEFSTGSGGTPYDSGWATIPAKLNGGALNPAGWRLEMRHTLTSVNNVITAVVQLRLRLVSALNSYRGQFAVYLDGTGILNWKRNEISGTTVGGVAYPARGTQQPVASNPAPTIELIAAVRPSPPSGGTTGQVLSKKTGTDFDYQWTTPSSGGGAALPPGGVVGASLVKKTGADNDVQWTRLDLGVAFSDTNPLLASDPITSYPFQVMQNMLTAAQSQSGGWPSGNNPCQIFTQKTQNGGASVTSQWCLSNAQNAGGAFAYFRSGHSTGWTPWVNVAEDTGWINLPLASGFTAASNATPAIKRVNGIVYYTGTILGTYPTSSTVTVATVPAGFRGRVGNTYGFIKACGCNIPGSSARVYLQNSSGSLITNGQNPAISQLHLEDLSGYPAEQ